MLKDIKQKKKKEEQKINVSKEAYKISLIYALFGALWILLSDSLLMNLHSDMKRYKYFQIYKGWFYIFITTLIVYKLINSRMKMWLTEYSSKKKAYQELKLAQEELITLESELDYQKKLNENIFTEAPSVIITWDDTGRILNINPFGEKLTGYTKEELLESKGWPVLIPEDRINLSRYFYSRIKSKKCALNYEGQIITKDGKKVEILWSSKILSEGDNGRNIYVSIGADIEAQKKYEEKITYMAYHDHLTGLPNRIMFEQEVSNRISKGDSAFAIVYMDIDNFKNINDSMGHQAGDVFLKYFTDSLVENVKEQGFIARLGGDEYAILFPCASKSEIIEKVENIANNIGNVWTYQNRQFYTSISMGIVMYPDNGGSTSELLKNADIAMYASKREGKNRILFYEDKLIKDHIRFTEMVNYLQQGLDEDQFYLVYQPQYRLMDQKLVGFEALLRWEHPKEGFISPGEFIPIAEMTGQIYGLERQVIRKALKQKKLWEEQGFRDITLAINLSTKTLTSKINFSEWEQILSGFSIDFSKVVIEITETSDIFIVDSVIERLRRLKKLGIKIALDDFGTGYSSLNYIKKLPIDIIKLDKSFIDAVTEDGIDTVLIKNILNLANDLNYEVIAEGIETKEQLERLIYYKCEVGQGYLLSRPLTVDRIRLS